MSQLIIYYIYLKPGMGSCSSPLIDKRPSLPVMHTQSTMESSPSKNIPLFLTLLDGAQTIMQAPVDLSIKQLKQEIAERYHIDSSNALIGSKGKPLKPEDDSRKLSQLQHPIDISIKTQIVELANLNAHNRSNQIHISQNAPTQKTTTMSCGHSFTQKQIACLLNQQIDAGADQILCPVPIGRKEQCGASWEEEEWRSAAGLTQQQLESICQKILINKIEGYKQQCPFCSEFSSSQEGKRLKQCCHVCEASFCAYCLNFWQGRKVVQCSSQRCQFIKKLAQDCSKSLSFRLFRRDTRQKEVVRVPQIRGCPRCGLLIETREASDKRARCICVQMGYSFCLVCLSLVEPSGKTKCGAYYEMCHLQQKKDSSCRL